MWLGLLLVLNGDPWRGASEEGEFVKRMQGYLRPPRTGRGWVPEPGLLWRFFFSALLLFVTFKIFGYFSVSSPYS